MYLYWLYGEREIWSNQLGSQASLFPILRFPKFITKEGGRKRRKRRRGGRKRKARLKKKKKEEEGGGEKKSERGGTR